jgi:hypothetical protein
VWLGWLQTGFGPTRVLLQHIDWCGINLYRGAIPGMRTGASLLENLSRHRFGDARRWWSGGLIGTRQTTGFADGLRTPVRVALLWLTHRCVWARTPSQSSRDAGGCFKIRHLRLSGDVGVILQNFKGGFSTGMPGLNADLDSCPIFVGVLFDAFAVIAFSALAWLHYLAHLLLPIRLCV